MSRNIHHYNNPDYNYHPCQRYRTHRLMFLNLQEIAFAQRMILSVVLGGVMALKGEHQKDQQVMHNLYMLYECE